MANDDKKMDIDDSDKDNKVKGGPEKSKEAKKDEVPKTVIQELKQNVDLLQQSVALFEWRYTARVIKTLPSLRHKLTSKDLRTMLSGVFKQDSAQRATLLSLLPEDEASASASASAPASDAMQVDAPKATTEVAKAEEAAKAEALAAATTWTEAQTAPLPEVDVYATLLVILFLIDREHNEQALSLVDHTATRVQDLNRRTMDQLAARIYFYYAHLHNIVKGSDGLASVRPSLLSWHRVAALRRDDESQATLLNLLLANYLHFNLYEQADKLVSKSNFPAESDRVSNGQWARWLYYNGRIRAIQLNYTEAHKELQHAIRRIVKPEAAAGFYQAAHKLFIVVQLLMGDIPERALFRQPVLRKSLAPYLTVVQAVRTGDLDQFSQSLNANVTTFRHDETYTLIMRLRHNVIKTGLRTISLSYSRISLSDVCTKLSLESEEEAEYIVAKAIRDGVVEAQLDHTKGIMKGRELSDVYSTTEPQMAFNERIGFCLQIHNEAVRRHRYPLTQQQKTQDEPRLSNGALMEVIEDMDGSDFGDL